MDNSSLGFQAVKRGDLPPDELAESYEAGCPNCGVWRDEYSTVFTRLWRVFFPRIKKGVCHGRF